MDKLDFKKRDRALYSGKAGVWAELDVPEIGFLSISGQGDPNGASYARALAALYPVAYAIKFARKANGADFVVPPLEALWWAEDPSAFVTGDRAAWRWTAMLRLPEGVGEDDLGAGQAVALKKLQKASGDVSALEELQLMRVREGVSLQTLHIGPYTDEAPTLADLHDRLMPERGLTFNGPHHEIYLSDPRRTAPEKLKTLLRQPVAPITTG